MNEDMIRLADYAMAGVLKGTAPIWRLFAHDPGRLPMSAKTLKGAGVWPIRDHYYYPLFNDAHLRGALSVPRSLPGLDLNEDGQVATLDELRDYGEELADMRLDQPTTRATKFSMVNDEFGPGDAEILYAMLRWLKPKRLVEIGSGHSTKLAVVALRANHWIDNIACRHVCVEPYENKWLDLLRVEVVRERVEELGVGFFATLEAGDVLFIDSSHMIRPQGDVLFEYLELLPTLAPGVVVHVHDVFTPRDYPDKWVREDVLMWNEQYLLEALLSGSERYEVLAALNWLKHEEYKRLAAACPYLRDGDEPGSMWLRVRKGAEGT